MKKFIILLSGIFLFVNVASSQGIDDRAVIPVAVTLNSILRLNVTSGGNIEFNFNTLLDYEQGIPTSAAYQTKFNVASSVDWDVVMYSENTELIGTDDASGTGETTNTMDLDFIGYHITSEGDLDDNYTFSFNDPTEPGPLTSDASDVLVGYDGTTSNAGDINRNNFTIHWECGTGNGTMNESNILTEGLAADRYATNVFLILQPTNN